MNECEEVTDHKHEEVNDYEHREESKYKEEYERGEENELKGVNVHGHGEDYGYVKEGKGHEGDRSSRIYEPYHPLDVHMDPWV